VTHRYFMCAGEQWRVSVATTPVAPAGRPRSAISVDEGRSRLYFYSASGIMRSVLHPSARRLTDADLAAMDDGTLCQLMDSPSTTEMGRVSVSLQDGR
jgi:hypothetical protein